jgi:hypothetical protein
MGVFSNIKNSGGNGGSGLYVSPGKYTFFIKRCKMIEGDFSKKKFFIAELEVVSSQKTEDNEPLAAGTEPDYLVDLGGKFPQLSMDNIADFMRVGLASLADASGEDRPENPDEIDLDEEMADSICEEENLLAGTFINCLAFNKLTREKKDFTRMKWSVPSNLDELAAAHDS